MTVDARTLNVRLRTSQPLSVTPASCRLRRMSEREREAEKLQAVKGMNDILPPDSAKWSYVEKRARATFENHGYREVRTPIVEYTPLFVRSIGEATDVV